MGKSQTRVIPLPQAKCRLNAQAFRRHFSARSHTDICFNTQDGT
ncbi:hypothetical protein [Neisseria bergeri]|nr:hypothetical protein [Neisseria bergeri]